MITKALPDEPAAATGKRAVDDPAALARGARIVRIALERGRLTCADLDGGSDEPTP